MREILADAMSLPEDLLGRGANSSRFGIKAEVSIDSRGKLHQCFPHRAAGRERFECIRCEFLVESHPRRCKLKLVCCQTLVGTILRERSGRLFPRKRKTSRRVRRAIDLNLTLCLDNEHFVRLFHREKGKDIAEVVDTFSQS